MRQIIFEQTKKVVAVAAISCLAVFMSSRSSAGTSAAPADAAATYKSKCASCHGADGGGQTSAGKSLKVKDLRGAEVKAMSDDQLLAIISKGKGKMPGYEKTLGAATCKALLAYIRQLK